MVRRQALHPMAAGSTQTQVSKQSFAKSVSFSAVPVLLPLNLELNESD